MQCFTKETALQSAKFALFYCIRYDSFLEYSLIILLQLVASIYATISSLLLPLSLPLPRLTPVELRNFIGVHADIFILLNKKKLYNNFVSIIIHTPYDNYHVKYNYNISRSHNNSR